MRIIVDAMGGDNAPLCNVQGALEAHRDFGVDILLVGRSEDILRCLEQCGGKDPARREWRSATQRRWSTMSDDPAFAFKQKKDSSLTVGLQLLKDGAGDAFVSAGSTGALLSGATLLVKRIRGIRRAAMAPQIPCKGGRTILCDCGANAECTPEYLLQFAYLGNFYAQRVLGVAKPRVALLNIGAEDEKGDALRHETLPLLKAADAQGRIHFVGSVEASDAMQGKADVIVADGFAGNVMLKSIEGTAKFLSGEIKGMLLASAEDEAGGSAPEGRSPEVQEAMLDPSEVGGTAFLGISKPVIKAHGSSDAKAIRSAIRQARDFAESGFIQAIEENIDCMKLEKGAS